MKKRHDWQRAEHETDRELIDSIRAVLGLRPLYRAEPPFDRIDPTFERWVLSRHFSDGNAQVRSVRPQY